MVDLLSILQTICGLGMKITVLVETFRHNEDDCRRLRQLIFRVSEIAKCLLQQLNRTTYIVEGDKHPMMSGAFMGLKEALEHGHRDIVVACQPKKGYLNDLMSIIKADDIAKELRRVSDDILSNMMVAILATVVCHFSVTAKTNRSDDALHADVKDLVNTVRARDASSSSKMVSLSTQIVDTLPRVHLPPEVSSSLQVEESVQTYRTSIRYAIYQNKDKREANKTMVHSSVKTSIEKNNVPVDHWASLASLYSDGSANKSASIKSVAGQGRQKARSSFSKLVDEVQSSLVAVSIRPSHLQRPMEPGNTSSNKKASPASAMGCTMGRPWVDVSSSSSTAVAWTTSGSSATSGRPQVDDGSSSLTVHTSLASKTYTSIRRPSLSMGERTTDIIDSSKTYASIHRPSLYMLYGNEAAMTKRQNGGSSSGLIRGPP